MSSFLSFFSVVSFVVTSLALASQPVSALFLAVVAVATALESAGTCVISFSMEVPQPRPSGCCAATATAIVTLLEEELAIVVLNPLPVATNA